MIEADRSNLSSTMVVATSNAGKLQEYVSMLEELPVKLLSLRDFAGVVLPPENGDSYAANALLKARSVAAATGLITLADDSGVEVEALGGFPGIRSARFAGEGASDEANNRHLLEMLAGVPFENRRARFRCVIALVNPASAIPFEEALFEGGWDGIIGLAPCGILGFGYDPLFYLPDQGCTVAQIPEGLKNRISHRAQALSKALPVLMEIFARIRMDG